MAAVQVTATSDNYYWVVWVIADELPSQSSCYPFLLSSILSLIITEHMVSSHLLACASDCYVWLIWHCRSLALLLLCSPPVLLLSVCLVFTITLPSSTDGVLSSFATLAAESQAFANTSYHLAGAWLYPVLCLFVWPVWFVFWCLSLTAVRTKWDNAFVKCSYKCSKRGSSPAFWFRGYGIATPWLITLTLTDYNLLIFFWTVSLSSAIFSVAFWKFASFWMITSLHQTKLL